MTHLRKFVSSAPEYRRTSILERYFKDKIGESEDITDIGNYWDKKGENEIIALN